MAENTTTEFEHHLFERPLPQCPACASKDLVPVRREAFVDFLCRQCSTCWHVELGAFWRVESPSARDNMRAQARA